MNDVTEILGYIAGTLTTICLLPQLTQLIMTKKSSDVSIPTFIILLLGQIIWIIYGVFIKDMRIIIANTISVFLGILIIFFAFMFKNKLTQTNLHHFI